MKKMFKYLYTLFIMFFSIIAFSHAQVIVDKISIKTDDENIVLGQPIKIYVEGYTTNLDAATISWAVDGKIVTTGKGIKNFEITLDDYNKPKFVEVRITSLEGDTYYDNKIFSTANMDLYYEALDSSVPPFYRGKALVGDQGKVRITVLPEIYSNNKRVSIKDLIYTWSKDDKIYPSYSGYGKYQNEIRADLLKGVEDIKVIASLQDGSVSSNKSFKLKQQPASIELYRVDNNMIYYNNALKNQMNFDKNQISLLASPYYFTNNADLSLLTYEWSSNGLPLLSDGLKVNLDKGDRKSGYLNLNVYVAHDKIEVQEASKDLQLIFK